MSKYKVVVAFIFLFAVLIVVGSLSRIKNEEEPVVNNLGWVYEQKEASFSLEEVRGYLSEDVNRATDTTIAGVERWVLSADKDRLLLEIGRYDTTQGASDFDGSFPLLSRNGFLCDLSLKRCEQTDIYTRADARAGKWVRWVAWSQGGERLYGHIALDGLGMRTPVFAFNVNNNALELTRGYENRENRDVVAFVPSSAFSSSAKNFVLYDKRKNALLLYDSNNLSSAKRIYDLGSMIDDSYSVIDRVIWSPDEKQLAIKPGYSRGFYLLDLASGRLSAI